MPLFPGYAFVNLAPDPESRRIVLRVQGVLHFVGSQNFGEPIADSQIEEIRALLAAKVPVADHPFLKIGQRVVIRGGALDGLEGILTGHNGSQRLVISVDSIERSLSISIEGYDIESV